MQLLDIIFVLYLLKLSTGTGLSYPFITDGRHSCSETVLAAHVSQHVYCYKKEVVVVHLGEVEKESSNLVCYIVRQTENTDLIITFSAFIH